MPITPNMGLVLPTPTVTIGPLYADQNNQAFSVVDSHNHASGNGVPIPSAGISLDGDLPFNSNNATLLRSTRFDNQVSPLSLVSDIRCLYVSGGNLYYNNNIGQQIQITAGAALNATTIGGIGGDYATSTASLYYTSSQQKFTFTSAVNTPASIDAGPLTIRNLTVSSFGITISPPGALSADYGLTLFNALPASTKILTVDNAGNIGAVYDVDNSTLEVSSNTIQVKNLGITAAKIANATITTTQIASNTILNGNIANDTITRAKLAAYTGQQISASCGAAVITSGLYTAVTNLSVTITTKGGPIVIALLPDGTGAGSGLRQQANVGTSPQMSMKLTRDNGGGPVDVYASLWSNFIVQGYNRTEQRDAPGVIMIDPQAAGTYTYTFYVANTTGIGGVSYVDYLVLCAYEL